MDGMSLLDVLRGVMLDPAEQAAYSADPGAYLGRYGYEDVDQADLAEAFSLVADTLPPAQAEAAWQAASGPAGEAFGAVTPDFDSDAGDEVGADAFGAGTALGEGPALGEEPVLDGTLSFGVGEAADGPPVPDAVAPDPAEGSPGDGEPFATDDGGFDEGFGAGVAEEGPADDDGLGGMAEEDDDVDEDGDVDGLDDDFGGLDDGPADDLDDDLGDVEPIDGLDDLAAPDPGDSDIGLF